MCTVLYTFGFSLKYVNAIECILWVPSIHSQNHTTVPSPGLEQHKAISTLNFKLPTLDEASGSLAPQQTDHLRE